MAVKHGPCWKNSKQINAFESKANRIILHKTKNQHLRIH